MTGDTYLFFCRLHYFEAYVVLICGAFHREVVGKENGARNRLGMLRNQLCRSQTFFQTFRRSTTSHLSVEALRDISFQRAFPSSRTFATTSLFYLFRWHLMRLFVLAAARASCQPFRSSLPAVTRRDALCSTLCTSRLKPHAGVHEHYTLIE